MNMVIKHRALPKRAITAVAEVAARRCCARVASGAPMIRLLQTMSSTLTPQLGILPLVSVDCLLGPDAVA